MKAHISQRQHGLSLVELMVAMAISLILLAGVLQIFLGSKQSYRVNENMSRIQESGRFAMELMARDIRMAGYQGCPSMETVIPNIIADPPPTEGFGIDTVVGGRNDVAAGTTLGGLTIDTGTDTISVQFASPESVNLSGNLGTMNANIQLSGNPAGWNANDVLFITDCTAIDIFRSTNVSSGASGTTIAHSTAANTTNFLSKLYGTDAMVMSYGSYTYFVSGGSLYRNANALIDGVLDMQILYGEDTSGDKAPDQYVTADDVGNWERVVAARVSLLLVGPDNNITTTNQTVLYNGADRTVDNRRLAKVFTTTIGMRNRLP